MKGKSNKSESKESKNKSLQKSRIQILIGAHANGE
jgi:hypothetical protein